MSETFIGYEKTAALYDWAITRIFYRDAFAYYNDNDSFQASDTYFDYLNTIDANNGELLIIPTYKQFINYYINYLADKVKSEETSDDTEDNLHFISAYKAVLANFTNVDVKNYGLYYVAKEQVNYYGIKGLNTYFEQFKTDCTNEAYRNNILEKYAEWLTIEPGKQADNFSYPDLEGNMHSLTDFLGKYVYLDVWATWCGPCKAEIPHLDTLYSDLKENNIAIISISVDEDKQAWESMITADQPEWMQLYAGGWKTPVAEFFLIRSIPRFILLDREGKIIDANATRPSENIKEQILALEGI